MREILFRGKDVVTGQMVYGNYSKWVEPMDKPIELEGITNENNISFVIESKSVEQYTGLNDVNGVKIFEGDITKTIINDNHWWVYKIGYVESKDNNLYQIPLYNSFNTKLPYVFDYIHKDCEVIGNIHDNPELLEVQDA